jgi:hypothetical protein
MAISSQRHFQIREIVDSRFPGFLIGGLERRHGPKPSAERIAAVEAFLQELNQLSDEELETRYNKMRAVYAEYFAKMAAKEEAERSISRSADFVYWAKAPYWTLQEAMALVLGKDPTAANSAASRLISTSPLAVHFSQTLQLAERAAAMSKSLRPLSLAPSSRGPNATRSTFLAPSGGSRALWAIHWRLETHYDGEVAGDEALQREEGDRRGQGQKQLEAMAVQVNQAVSAKPLQPRLSRALTLVRLSLRALHQHGYCRYKYDPAAMRASSQDRQ